MTITVAPVNDAPVADDDAVWVFVDTTWTVVAPGVLVDDSDVDGDSLTASLNEPPAHGAVLLQSDGGYIYTPDTGYTGNDHFTYMANDGMVDSNVATVRVTVSLDMFRTMRDFLRVTEVNYNPYGVTVEESAAGVTSRDAFEFIELKNTGRETLDLAGLQVNGGARFQNEEETLLGPDEFALLVKDRTALSPTAPPYRSMRIWCSTSLTSPTSPCEATATRTYGSRRPMRTGT